MKYRVAAYGGGLFCCGISAIAMMLILKGVPVFLSLQLATASVIVTSGVVIFIGVVASKPKVITFGMHATVLSMFLTAMLLLSLLFTHFPQP